jgi:hypothetical protein
MKNLKIKLRAGSKLSDTFANSHDCYKVVESDHVLGHIVSLDGSVVYALYRADVHVKTAKGWAVVSSYEYGTRLNGFTFTDDDVGCTFAQIAGHAVRVLENRRILKEKAASKKRKRS